MFVCVYMCVTEIYTSYNIYIRISSIIPRKSWKAEVNMDSLI